MRRRESFGDVLLFLVVIAAGQPAQANNTSENRPVVVKLSGCNAVALAQIPGSVDLFVGRQMLTADGQLAGVSGPNDCSGGNPENERIGKIFNRWGLILDKFDWIKGQFTILKPLLDTSVDRNTKSSSVLITSGAMRGAIIRSAYDPDVVRFHGTFLISYECTLEDGRRYGVKGTSSCISVYNADAEEIDRDRTEVIISGIQSDPTHFTAAAVPALFVFRDRIFLYWSALSIVDGTLSSITLRGAELIMNRESISVKGAKGRLVYAADETLTTRVWDVDRTDPLANTTVDLRMIWAVRDGIVAAAGLGGSGCTAPSDRVRGCFRLTLAKAIQPLGKDVFNKAKKIDQEQLPSNAQEYTRPIRDPEGRYRFLGHFLRPEADEFGNLHPIPGMEFWEKSKLDSAVVMFPIADRSLWPTSSLPR